MKINRMLMSAVGALVLSGVAMTAHAETVTYSTSGAFSGTATGEILTPVISNTLGVSSVTIVDASGTATITFTGEPGDTVNAPTFNPLGTFTVTSTATTPNAVDLTGLTFVLTVNQTIPGLGGGSFGSGSVTGAMNSTSSGTYITFSSPTVVGPFDGVTYGLLLDNLPPNSISLVAPSAGSPPGTTTVEGDIEAPAVPVPASVLSGSALLSGLMLAKKLRSRRAI